MRPAQSSGSDDTPILNPYWIQPLLLLAKTAPGKHSRTNNIGIQSRHMLSITNARRPERLQDALGRR